MFVDHFGRGFESSNRYFLCCFLIQALFPEGFPFLQFDKEGCIFLYICINWISLIISNIYNYTNTNAVFNSNLYSIAIEVITFVCIIICKRQTYFLTLFLLKNKWNSSSVIKKCTLKTFLEVRLQAGFEPSTPSAQKNSFLALYPLPHCCVASINRKYVPL